MISIGSLLQLSIKKNGVIVAINNASGFRKEISRQMAVMGLLVFMRHYFAELMRCWSLKRKGETVGAV